MEDVSLSDSEKNRESAEYRRVRGEQSRRTAETRREVAADEHDLAAEGQRAAELGRQGAEATRTDAEVKRRWMEEAREVSENIRLASETAREYRDAAQVAAEAARKDAESARVDAAHATAERALLEKMAGERQLQQSQKMEAVGQLAGGVVHDFNNLLTVISSYSAMILKDPLIGMTSREDVQEIANAASRAAILTHQLLEFSRKQVLQPRPVDLNTIIQNVEMMLRHLIGENIELVMHTESPVELVNVDPSQLEQVLVNLVVNARDAMPHGGRLTIETSNVELSAADVQRHSSVDVGPYIMLAVVDTGVGIAQDILAHVFEPFFTTKELGKGTGLGLSMVRSIVRQCGGDIWVSSEPGHGTAFTIYLPRISVHDGSFESAQSAPPSVGVS